MGKKAKQPALKAPAAGGWKGKICDAAAKFEAIAYRAASLLPSGRLKLWLDGFFRPQEAHDRAGSVPLSELFGNLLLFYFIYSAIFLAAMVAVTSLLAPADAAMLGFEAPSDPLWSALTLLVANTIVSAISALFAFALIFASALALGGKGKYVRQSYPMSLVLCGSNALLLGVVACALLTFVPAYLLRGVFLAGEIASLAAILANVPLLLLCVAIILYTLYAYYLVVKKAHNLSSWRAAAAMLLAALLVLLIDFAARMAMGG